MFIRIIIIIVSSQMPLNCGSRLSRAARAYTTSYIVKKLFPIELGLICNLRFLLHNKFVLMELLLFQSIVIQKNSKSQATLMENGGRLYLKFYILFGKAGKHHNSINGMGKPLLIYSEGCWVLMFRHKEICKGIDGLYHIAELIGKLSCEQIYLPFTHKPRSVNSSFFFYCINTSIEPLYISSLLLLPWTIKGRVDN